MNDPEIFQRGHSKHKMDSFFPTSFSSSLPPPHWSLFAERLKPSATVPVSQTQVDFCGLLFACQLVTLSQIVECHEEPVEV